MVTDRLRDGVRIAQLLASEVTGDQGRLKTLSVADADTDVEPTLDGTLAYRITREDEPIVDAYVQPDRLRLEFTQSLKPRAMPVSGCDPPVVSRREHWCFSRTGPR